MNCSYQQSHKSYYNCLNVLVDKKRDLTVTIRIKLLWSDFIFVTDAFICGSYIKDDIWTLGMSDT